MSDHTRDFVKWRSPVTLSDSLLHCPNCGSTYLHQEKIYVYTRAEDAPSTVLSVDAQCGETENLLRNGDSQPLGNPSRRRDGIRVFFSCEGFDASIHMTIAQHQGNTYVEMEHVEHGRFSAVEWP